MRKTSSNIVLQNNVGCLCFTRLDGPKDPGLTTMHCAPLLSFILALKGDIHEVPDACFLVFARQQFYSFSLLATRWHCSVANHPQLLGNANTRTKKSQDRFSYTHQFAFRYLFPFFFLDKVFWKLKNFTEVLFFSFIPHSGIMLHQYCPVCSFLSAVSLWRFR